jgi:hypothetical protein
MQSRAWGSKCGEDAGKVNVLTWGDLLSGYRSSNLGREDKLRQQESAEAIWYQLGGVNPLGRAERKVSLEWKVVGMSEESRISLNGETTG